MQVLVWGFLWFFWGGKNRELLNSSWFLFLLFKVSKKWLGEKINFLHLLSSVIPVCRKGQHLFEWICKLVKWYCSILDAFSVYKCILEIQQRNKWLTECGKYFTLCAFLARSVSCTHMYHIHTGTDKGLYLLLAACWDRHFMTRVLVADV